MTRRVEPLGTHDVRTFRSGVHALDDYLRRHARPNAELGIGAAWLLLRGDNDPQEWPEVLGYFTLSMTTLPRAAMVRLIAPRFPNAKIPAYPMPAALIGRLANDRRVRGAGVGAALLGEALHKVLSVADVIACTGVVVDAKDEAAYSFYLKHGFLPVEDGEAPFPRQCFMSLDTLRQVPG